LDNSTEKVVSVNKILLMLGIAAAAVAQLGAQVTVTYTDNSNTGISPNMVLGDSFTVSVSAGLALANSSVTSVSNGQNWSLGQTDAMGNWAASGTATNVGNWTVTYSVGGVAASLTSFQVIDKPTGLTATSIVLASPNCNLSQAGDLADITYQITGASGNISTLVTMTQTENGTYAPTYYNGVQIAAGSSVSNLSTCAGSPWTCSTTASSSGTFHDVPLGACYTNAPTFTQSGTTQTIYIKIGAVSYMVRSNTWNFSGAGVGHGNVTNNNDINLSR
jgi:hypothetical protein